MNKEGRLKARAWLVTWEWAGDHAQRCDKVAAIFNPRWSAQRVREFVEFIYLSDYTLSERLVYAVHKRRNPYLATFGPTTGEIHCGHNPWLYARCVDDLTVERDANGKEMVTWKERPKPNLSWTRRTREA